MEEGGKEGRMLFRLTKEVNHHVKGVKGVGGVSFKHQEETCQTINGSRGGRKSEKKAEEMY